MLLDKRIPILPFIKIIKVDLIIIAVFAFTVGVLDQYSFLKEISIPLPVTAIIGTTLALLLAFRISQSYGRWWEARIIWGAIVNDSRTLVRQVISFHKNSDESDHEVINNFAYRQIHWCHTLCQGLRKLPYSKEVYDYLTTHSIKADNIPNALLSIHSGEIKKALVEGKINQYQQIQLDETILRLCASMGMCERIKNTVFPKSYSLMIHFTIYVFATLLPFGISDDLPLLEIALTIILPSIFIAIEETSILMQDPFENQPLDTPMTALCKTIEINLKEMIEDRDVPVREKETGYYVL